MRIVEQSAVMLNPPDPQTVMELIEKAGRICYQSEGGDTNKFVRNIISRGHLSVIEHVSISFHLVTDRGVSHELVRHRLASYSQESTRYVNYTKKQMAFIKPVGMPSETYVIWQFAMDIAEKTYQDMIWNGVTPEIARSVLPNSLKTELVMTANLREWLHIIKLRTDVKAHPQIRELIGMVAEQLKELLPVIFGGE